jgi:hypothetical protein
LYGLPRRKEELRSEIPKAELGLPYLRAEDLLSRMKFWAREEGRLRDHWQDWPGAIAPCGPQHVKSSLPPKSLPPGALSG